MYDIEIQENSIPVYIGKTKNFQKRMYQHFHECKNGKMTEEQYNSIKQIKIIELPSYADAGILERYLIGKFQPIYNTQIKTDGIPSFDISINFSQYPIKIINKPHIKNKTKRNFIPLEIDFNIVSSIIKDCCLIISEDKISNMQDFIFCYNNQQDFKMIHVFNKNIKSILTNTTANINKKEMDYIYSIIMKNKIPFIDSTIIDSNIIFNLFLLKNKKEIINYLKSINII